VAKNPIAGNCGNPVKIGFRDFSERDTSGVINNFASAAPPSWGANWYEKLLENLVCRGLSEGISKLVSY
jgi:hypothetical protein